MSELTGYVTHPDCSRHDTGWKHPDHQGRLAAVARAVHRDMLTLHERLREVEGVPATREELRLAHTAAHLDRVEARCRDAAAAGGVLPLQEGIVVSAASWDAAVAAVGCVITAASAVIAGELTNAFCAVRPPGHGASADAAGGFSLLNAVAIGALCLRRGREPRRVWVIDLASRPGLGTAGILRHVDGVKMVSIHSAEHVFEAPSKALVARPVTRGAGGGEVLEALSGALDEAEEDPAPDIILLSLGFDALETDPLGSLALRPRDYFDLTAAVRSRAERLCGGRLVSVLEEGYDAPATAQGVVQHLRALAGFAPHEG